MKSSCDYIRENIPASQDKFAFWRQTIVTPYFILISLSMQLQQIVQTYFTHQRRISQFLNQRNQTPAVDAWNLLLSINAHVCSKTSFWNAQQANYLPGSQINFAALFVLNYWLREFPLSAIENRFESRCQQKQLMLLSYKICPCCLDANSEQDGQLQR